MINESEERCNLARINQNGVVRARAAIPLSVEDKSESPRTSAEGYERRRLIAFWQSDTDFYRGPLPPLAGRAGSGEPAC